MLNVRCLWSFCLCLLVAGAPEAAAQPREPVGPFVLDARGTLARFKEDPGVADAIGVQPADLPTRGLGIALGAHWYPIRGRRASMGLGGEVLVARGSETAEATAPAVQGATVSTRLSALSPQVSLNFGKRDGWSYISGGMGLATLTAERQDAPFAGGSRVRTINYGGGARWFTGPRLAFSFDLRFYSVGVQAASGTRPAFPPSKMMVISAGISLR